ncbi:MAG: glycosyltransferase family 2 protein, partial [Candidatus Doudnabacteria bacterium]|nr:glycosyltransferase family 2 protein [Candidatus Doudnabacteria bacterium]
RKNLISVSGKGGGEKGTRRFGLNTLREALQNARGLDGMTDADLENLIQEQRLEVIKGINGANERFDEFEKKEKIKAGILGGVMGIAGGAVAQFGIDQLRGHGIPFFDSQKHGSLIEGAWHKLRGESPYETYSGALAANVLPDGGRVNLPPGYTIADHLEHGKHFVDIIDNDGNISASHLEVDHGKFTPEALQDLKEHSFGFSESSAQGDIELGSQNHIASVDELKQLLPDLGKYARVHWHDEAGKVFSKWFGKPIEFEGKQQMQYLERDPGSGMVFMNIKALAHNMAENAKRALSDPDFGKSPDGSIDHKLVDLAKTLISVGDKPEEYAKHFQAVIIPTEEANKLGLSAMSNEALVDGYKLPLPKATWGLFDSEAKLHDGSIPFRFMEERFDGHVLNTTQGHNYEILGGTSIDHKIPVIDVRPPQNPDWITPFPFWPRFALEKTPNGPLPLGRYYGLGRPENYQEVLRNAGIEPQPPEKTRDVSRERERIKHYLDKLPKTYVDELRQLKDSMRPMSDQTRVAIMIPAYNEAANLERLLDQYTKQIESNGKKLDPRIYEIDIIVNRPQGAPADNSVDVIKKFKDEHPEYQINVIDKEFPRESAGVGLARKYLADLILLRSQERKNPTGQLYMESEDADLLEVDPETVVRLMNKYDKNPELDALRGKQDRYPEVMAKNDMFFLNRRMDDFWEVLMRDKKFRPKDVPNNFVWNRVVTGGWNTSFTAEVYAQIGGYSPLKVGEDMYIGEMISVFRGKRKGDNIEPNVKTISTIATRSDSSPRRYLDAMIRGIDPYADFHNESIKFKSIDDFLQQIKPYETLNESNTRQLETLLSGKYRHMIKPLIGEEQGEKFLGRLMHWLGFKKDDWKISPSGAVEIMSIKNVKKALDDYKIKPIYKIKDDRRKARLSSVGQVTARVRTGGAPPGEPMLTTAIGEAKDLIGDYKERKQNAAIEEMRKERAVRRSTSDSVEEPAGNVELTRPAEIVNEGPSAAEIPIDPEREAEANKVRETLKLVERRLKHRIRGMEKYGAPEKQEIEDQLTTIYNEFKKINPSNGSAKREFAGIMQTLGFKKDDWKELAGGKIQVNRIENAKLGTKKERREDKEQTESKLLSVDDLKMVIMEELGKNSNVTVKELNLKQNPASIGIEGRINAQGYDVGFSGEFKSTDNKIVMIRRQIDANILVRAFAQSRVNEIPDLIKKVLEQKYGQKITAVRIGHKGLTVDMEKKAGA